VPHCHMVSLKQTRVIELASNFAYSYLVTKTNLVLAYSVLLYVVFFALTFHVQSKEVENLV